MIPNHLICRVCHTNRITGTTAICDECADKKYCWKGCGDKVEGKWMRCKECEKKSKRLIKEVLKFFKKEGLISW